MPTPTKEVIELATATVEFATTVAGPLVIYWVTRKVVRKRRRGS